jgi:hypothetical protein
MLQDSKIQDNYNLQIPWVEGPLFEDNLHKILGDSEKKQLVRKFREDGLIKINLNADNLIDKYSIINDQINKFISFKDYSPDGNRIQDAWRFSNEVKELAGLEMIMKWLSLLYQRKPIPFQTLNFKKGTEQGMHSDTIHFHCLPHRFMVGVWIAFEDVDEENGPLFYYPGSHKLPIYDFFDIGLNARTKQNLKDPSDNYKIYSKFIENNILSGGFERKYVTVKKGDIIIWAANLVHGGSKILDNSRTRYSQVTHYFFEGCMYYVPMYSIPNLGKYYFKEVTDVSNNNIVGQSFLNRPLEDFMPVSNYSKKLKIIDKIKGLLSKK